MTGLLTASSNQEDKLTGRKKLDLFWPLTVPECCPSPLHCWFRSHMHCCQKSPASKDGSP